MMTVQNKVEPRVHVIQDTIFHDYPELWLEVYVEGSDWDVRHLSEMFVRARCYKADTPEYADLVIFAGGEDINPALYNQEPHDKTSFNSARDDKEVHLYNYCLENGIPMVGVCRGAQLLHVMNGGSLYQDVDGHYSAHPMFHKKGNRLISSVSSVHHQMCQQNKSMEILAVAHQSTKRFVSHKDFVTGKINDIEAFFYRDTGCLGIQGHPEYRGYPEFTAWSLKQIEDNIIFNPDFRTQDKMLRMKPDILAERKFLREQAKEKVN